MQRDTTLSVGYLVSVLILANNSIQAIKNSNLDEDLKMFIYDVLHAEIDMVTDELSCEFENEISS